MTSVFNWQLLRAGSLRLDGGGMFSVVPKTLWSKIVTPDEDNRIPLHTNCLLLERAGIRILIETGFGEKWTDKERGFYDLQRRTIVDALREIDVEPASIDHVIVTHLHFDHAAGLTHLENDQPISTFREATIHVQRQEWLDALANKSTMTRTYLRTHLDPIEPQLHLIDGNADILPGLDVFPMPGHTWGQQAVRFRDRDGIVVFPGDVLPTVNHAPLAFSLGYDMMPYDNMLTKKRLLEDAARESWRLALDHEPGNPIVRAERDSARPDRFALRAVD